MGSIALTPAERCVPESVRSLTQSMMATARSQPSSPSAFERSTRKKKAAASWASARFIDSPVRILSIRSGASPVLLANVWEQRHKTCTLDGRGDRMLTGCCATTLASTDDSALAIHHLFQQFHVLVINVHRTWSLTIDENRVFFPCSRANS